MNTSCRPNWVDLLQVSSVQSSCAVNKPLSIDSTWSQRLDRGTVVEVDSRSGFMANLRHHSTFWTIRVRYKQNAENTCKISTLTLNLTLNSAPTGDVDANFSKGVKSYNIFRRLSRTKLQNQRWNLAACERSRRSCEIFGRDWGVRNPLCPLLKPKTLSATHHSAHLFSGKRKKTKWEIDERNGEGPE